MVVTHEFISNPMIVATKQVCIDNKSIVDCGPY